MVEDRLEGEELLRLLTEARELAHNAASERLKGENPRVRNLTKLIVSNSIASFMFPAMWAEARARCEVMGCPFEKGETAREQRLHFYVVN